MIEKKAFCAVCVARLCSPDLAPCDGCEVGSAWRFDPGSVPAGLTGAQTHAEVFERIAKELNNQRVRLDDLANEIRKINLRLITSAPHEPLDPRGPVLP